MSEYKVNKLSPMVPSENLQVTKDFMVKCFDFNVFMDTENYCIVYKDNYAVHIMPSEGEIIDEMSFYLEVDDLNLCWKTFSDNNNGDVKVKEPFDREYGMREFHVVLPDTKTLVFVGQFL